MCPCSLDSKEHVLLPLWSFQGAREPIAHEKNRPQMDGLSKLNSVTGSRESRAEVDVVPGEPDVQTAHAIAEGNANGSGHRWFRRLPE